MMRPIGLFLAEFRPDGPKVPAFGNLPLLTDERADTGDALMAFEMPDFDGAPAFDSEPVSLTADGLFEAEAEAAAVPDTAALLAALEAEHAETLASARSQWAEEEGAVLAERIGQAFADLETRLAGALALVLEPFLAKAAQQKMLEQLGQTLAALLGGGETRAVTVSGPADLLTALRTAYGDRPSIAFVEAEAADVTVALGDTRIRSQLRSWTRKLEAALGADA